MANVLSTATGLAGPTLPPAPVLPAVPLLPPVPLMPAVPLLFPPPAEPPVPVPPMVPGFPVPVEVAPVPDVMLDEPLEPDPVFKDEPPEPVLR